MPCCPCKHPPAQHAPPLIPSKGRQAPSGSASYAFVSIPGSCWQHESQLQLAMQKLWAIGVSWAWALCQASVHGTALHTGWQSMCAGWCSVERQAALCSMVCGGGWIRCACAAASYGQQGAGGGEGGGHPAAGRTRTYAWLWWRSEHQRTSLVCCVRYAGRFCKVCPMAMCELGYLL